MLVINKPAVEYMRELRGDRCRKHFSIKNVTVKCDTDNRADNALFF